MYVDGFVIPVPKAKKQAYLKMARKFAKIYLECGALEVRECIADDVKPGKWTSFPQAVKLKKGEVVWFSYVVHRNRKQRDRAMAKIMKDPRLADMMSAKNMPFDGKRMIFGGFEVQLAA